MITQRISVEYNATPNLSRRKGVNNLKVLSDKMEKP